MKLKVYAYHSCDTCRRAIKFLNARGIPHTVVPIAEAPPTKPELRRMLDQFGGDIRRLFNTSGQEYRRLNLKDRVGSMGPEEALDLLAANGRLVKRPFLIGGNTALVGFKEEEWQLLA